MHKFIWLLCFLGLATVSLGQRDTLSDADIAKLTKKAERASNRSAHAVQWFFQPLVGYTPETDWGFGATATRMFSWQKHDSITPLSSIQFLGMYTLNQQTLLNVNFNLFPNTRWRFNGSFGYNVYPYFYAGTGNTHNGEYLEWYDATYPFVHVSAFRRIKKSAFWMVGKIDFQYTEITQLKEPGLLATTRPLGYNGSTQLQPQLGVLFNTRDYESSATKGWYALVSAGGNLTGYTNTVCQIDVRKYFNLTPKNDVLALQAYGTFNNQEVPFNLLAQLGGSNLMRGYRQGVYRDQQMVVYQMELRTRLFWKLLSFSAFGNMGVVGANWEDMQAHYRYTYGAGVRVAVDAKKRQFVRIDYGASEQFQGVYFAIGEAF